MNRLEPLRRPLAATLRQRLFGPLALLLAGALTACGGGSGSSSLASNSSCGATTCGAAVVTITDAPGDFLSYTVNIVSLKLTRDDGTVVETLPTSTAVDFAKLVDLTEVVSARQIPPGKYVSGKVTLDYTGATIVVDDGTSSNGVAVKPVDGDGAALGTVEMDVQFDSSKPLVITDRTAGHIAFDFNLLASNAVDLTATPDPTVTVTPVLVASVVPPDHKDLRVRGPLVSADKAGNAYKVTVNPFYSTSTSMSQGDFTVHVNAATSYEIDGVAFTGDAGLEKLATLTAGTLTAAFGTLTTADHVFTATRVLAGSSVENSHQDGVGGVVVARSGNQLTLRGVTLERRDGHCGYDRNQVTINIDDTTGVTKEGETDAAAIGDISVGQRIHAFGTLDRTDPAHPVLDATGAVGGRVRLEITSLWGLVNTATAGSGGGAGSAEINLESIEGLRMQDRHGAATFDFTGTGAPQDPPADPNPDDADPAHYLIDTGALPLPASFVTGSPARFFGFVTPFGAAAPTATPPVADFSAVTLVDYALTSARLKIDWEDPGVTAPFVTPLADTGLTLGDLSASTRHGIGVGPLQIDLTTLATPVQIVGDTASTALFAIAHEATHQSDIYSTFGAFVAALTTALDGTNTVEHVVAEGTYDSGAAVFTAMHMAVVLEN